MKVRHLIARVTLPVRSLVIKSLRNVTQHNNQQYRPPDYTIAYYITEVDAAIAANTPA